MTARPRVGRPAFGEPTGALVHLRALAFRALGVGLRVARRLPDRPLYRAAYAVGVGLSFGMPARRLLVRANLARVCGWLTREGLASPRVAAAAADGRMLDGLVRAAFGHWALTYLESALAPRYSADELRQRIRALHPETAARSLVRPGPGEVGSIQLAMHFGSVDLSALYATRVEGRTVTAPMERVDDPVARDWFQRVRGALGVTIVPTRGAAAALVGAIERGELVGLVADRVVDGGGVPVMLFGAPTRLPVGPAALSVQTGAPIWLQAVERLGPGEWLGHTVPIRPGAGLTGRAAIRSALVAEARAFERIVARAPEQWSTLFFPIWGHSAVAT